MQGGQTLAGPLLAIDSTNESIRASFCSSGTSVPPPSERARTKGRARIMRVDRIILSNDHFVHDERERERKKNNINPEQQYLIEKGEGRKHLTDNVGNS